MTKKIFLAGALMFSVAWVSPCQAAVPPLPPGTPYQYWTLNDYTGGTAPATADLGGGVLTPTADIATLSAVAGSSLNVYEGYTAGTAMRWTNPDEFWEDSFVLQFDRNGRTDLVLTYDVEAPGTVRQNAWFWSTDGLSYTLIAALDVSNTESWETVTLDLSHIGALNSAATIYLRSDLSGSFGAGYMSFDNFQVTMIPEPASVGLLLFALGALHLLRSRRAP